MRRKHETSQTYYIGMMIETLKKGFLMSIRPHLRHDLRLASRMNPNNSSKEIGKELAKTEKNFP